MIMYVVTGIVSILAMVHAYRSGRERYWILIILMFPFMGVLAYCAFEIMPEIMGPAGARARVRAAANPINRLYQAEQELGLADTAANHLAKADALSEMGSYGEAVLHYRTALDRSNGKDEVIEAKLAAALFETGQLEEALAMVELLETPRNAGAADRLSLLHARILAEMGQTDSARTIYADIVDRLPGQEARCRYAALLLGQGETEEARVILQVIEKGLKQSKVKPSADEATMHGWALAELAKLKTAP